MADQPFIVVRLVPESAIDGTTFSTYLDNLALQVLDANTGDPLSGQAYCSPLTVFQWPPGTGSYLAVAAEATSAPTDYDSSAKNYGDTLSFDSTVGISAGSYVYSADQTTIPLSGMTVSKVDPGSVTLSGTLSTYVPQGTVVSFIGQPGSGSLPSGPGPSFTLTATSASDDPNGDSGLIVLNFPATTGVTIGMGVSGPSITSGTVVIAVTQTTVVISAAISGSATSVGSVTFTLEPPFAAFTPDAPTSATPAHQQPGVLTFASGQTDGIAVGAILTPIPGVIAPGTTVTGATDKTIDLSAALIGALPAGRKVTFNFVLSSGIVQHTEPIKVGWSFFGGDKFAIIPAAVATAVIQLDAAAPPYLDIKIKANRGTEVIPLTSTYYNVKVTAESIPPTGDLYQQIPEADTSLYLIVPPVPGASTIALEIPPDGSAPPFDTLRHAMETALKNDPIKPGLTAADLITSATWCKRIAYDIVWSYQNDLPPLPDPVESLYSSPPNTSDPSGTNNLEMDRQKFEGALNSFYSTRNASAERLTKFVAAASAAIACEQLSRSAPAALLEFPVDPSAAFAAAVESEIVLDGLGEGGPSGLDFGVPAAFFYVLGANLDQTTNAAQRFQMAAGDSIDRLLHQFAAMGDAGLIGNPQPFADPAAEPSEGITSFQAARRLVALGVSAASSSPPVLVLAGSPLASLVSTWLAATDPAGTQSPPPSPQSDDFSIWSQQIALLDQQGYLDLDLDALTQGFVIPPFGASPSAGVSSGSTLTFPAGAGIGAGMPVSGPGIAPGTTVQAVTPGASGAPSTVTLKPAVTGSITTATLLAFNCSIPPVPATSSAPCPAGTAALALDATTGISAGMTVLGAGIAPGTTVLGVTASGVTLSTGAAATVPASAPILFAVAPGLALPPVTGTTTTECPSGTSLLTVGTATGISAGMNAAGAGLAPGTTVLGVTATTVTLSSPATAKVLARSSVTFFLAAGDPLPTLAATTTQKCDSGASDLTFDGSGGTGSISAGMSAFGAGLTAGSTVLSVAASTVTLSTGVAADVPAGTVITFAFLPSTLADQIAAWLPGTTVPAASSPTIATLKQVTAAQWTGFFAQPGSPQWLPPFTQPVAPGAASGQASPKAGYVATRVRAFVRAVQQFFTVSTVSTVAALPQANAPATIDVPGYDPIQLAAENLPAGTASAFTFGTGAVPGQDLAAAAEDVFPGDPAARGWLIEAMTTINELAQIAKAAVAPTPRTGTLPPSVSFSFSVMEALYARGFAGAADVVALSQADFQQALTGTVAYESFGELYQAAVNVAQTSPAAHQPEAGAGFQPVNPDGSLVNCVPPPSLSPTGPIAYLQEMLGLSELSRCDELAAAPLTLVTVAETLPGSPVLTFAAPADVLTGLSATAGQILAGTTVVTVTADAATVMVTLSNPLGTDAPPGTSVLFTAPTLGAVLSQRRGPVGTLTASRANLECPLPLIDLVNECLEYLAAAATPSAGAVYDTVAEVLAGDGPDDGDEADRLLAARPEHSTPAVPDAASAAFTNLKMDFSSCLLPYSQALDVSRTYLGQLGSTRFEEMRAFRRCITEFVLDPGQEPAGFQSWRWRYPVRADIAIEYLGITPEEYATLFHGPPVPPCAPPDQGSGGTDTAPAPTADVPVARPGMPAAQAPRSTTGLPAFLAETCLTYCEFYELWKSGYVPFRNGADQKDGAFPQCEPCCPDDLWLQFPGEQQEQQMAGLWVFVRLWRKLRESCGAGYSFTELRDICEVLQLQAGGAANRDFIRQLAAFQMLRDDFGLPLADLAAPPAPGATGADRTHLLALWAGPAAAQWAWAVRQLITRVEHRAQRWHGCQRRPGDFGALLTANLDRLSRLAGFDPDSATYSWHARPAHTLRFAEVLAKVYASRFSVGELLYMFTADPPLDGDDPFPLQETNEALDSPLGLPDDEADHALWRLRREMLKPAEGDEAEADEADEADEAEDEAEEWPWRRIESALQAEFGFAAADIAALGEHFFAGVLARGGQPGTPSSARFVTSLAAASTSALMWNDPPDGPLRYDPAAEQGQLSARIPLTDRAVISKLTHVRDLNAAEQQAVQDLFFQPRALLAGFALLFTDFAAAQQALIEEPDEACRFGYFRRQFLLCRHRSRLIARHLARHVTDVTGQEMADDDAAALLLRTMDADENSPANGASWESDSGDPPGLTWSRPSGSALAALLGLAGPGLTAEYRTADGTVVWRDVPPALGGFGHERDRENCPVPTVLPAFDVALPPRQLQFASVHNGFLMKDTTGAWLGGAQGFTVTWSGALLIDGEGRYEFRAGSAGPGGERPGGPRWRVVLRRGQRTWMILSHRWAGEQEAAAATLPLRRGAYALTVELVQPAPDFGNDEEVRAGHTGLEVTYCGPDTAERRIEIPRGALFGRCKDRPLGAGIHGLSPGAAAYLGGLYGSTLRDIRRTYQRAFKALLFCRRLGLSAERQPHGTSELGFLLAQPRLFAGVSYYRGDSGFTQHAADLDFDFLPLRDGYDCPAPGTDARTAPLPQRTQAMFDWWERLFDYTAARADVRRRDGRPLWLLFEEAQQKQPAHPGYLLRHLAADARHWPLDLRYFQGQNAPVYEVTSADLSDERWALRAWHADRWLRSVQDRCTSGDIEAARPDLWASDDPSGQLLGETQTGNANLLGFAAGGYLGNGAPRRYADLQRLNDGLRDRGRRALIAYLCRMDRVGLPWQPGRFAIEPGDLSDLLLLDVEAGLRERASRIEEAITAVQSFIRRARLGLEPGWTVTREFARLWDSRFDTYQIWERARRRELYRETWIEWEELAKARRIEAFRFLESQLRSSTLTLAVPGGLDWWPGDGTAPDRAADLLQRRVPAELIALPPAPPAAAGGGQAGTTPPTTREGLTVLGQPEYAAQPTWLAAVPRPSASGTSGGTDTPGGTGDSGTPAVPDGQPPQGTSPAPDDPAGAGPQAATAPVAPATARSLAAAAAAGSAQPESLPLWMESAMKLGTQFVRVAAAGAPEAARRFVPRGGDSSGACCRECGRDHRAGVDEYYFWLVGTQVYTYSADTDSSQTGDASFTGSYQFGFQDSYYDQFQQQSGEWNDEDQVPPLLAKWQPQSAVRLAWCRVHNGEFGEPRRSEDYVAITAQPDLLFLGRAWDSLYFEVTGAAALPPGYGSGDNADTSPPGFRYDLPSDHAVGLPQVLTSPAPPITNENGLAAGYPGGLTSYPFFAYDEPGSRLFPSSWFSASLTVAGALQARCGYDLALKWYRRSFDPLQQDNTWVYCPGSVDTAAAGTEAAAPGTEAAAEPARPGACCDSANASAETARNRAITLHYCRTLIDWADALLRQRQAPEAFQQARVLYDTAARITGPRPRTIQLPEPAATLSVHAFVPAYAPLNPQLMNLYDLIADRRGLVHRSLDARRLRNGRPGRDMPYFGGGPAAEQHGPDSGRDECAAGEDGCGRPSPYRFLSQIQKAIELTGRVRELGAALLSGYEKGDAEYLAAIHAEQEREMQALGIAIRQDQWRDADWQVQALQQTKDLNQANLIYNAGLCQAGLINNEIQNLDLTTNALQTRTGANLVEATGEIMNIIPDTFFGAVSSGASPPIGTKLAHLFEAIGRVMQTVADIQSTTAAMDMTQAGWQRRAVEWLHQTQTLPIEIQQIELQILGAHRRRDQALRELNNQQRQIEHATEVLDFLRDKFTAAELYLWLQRETAALHRQMYELARQAAREAERSFHFELRRTRRRFLPEEPWDSLHSGLLAGERLDLALRQMEKAYLDENRRELELTKHISLRLDFPLAYLQLRTTGYCEIAIPEWLFDVDYPGHYLRRIKALQATVPVVAGPMTGVHCRLTMLSSMTRVSPEVRPPAGRCCPECAEPSEYAPCAHDPRVVREYAARESIATSGGQNDSGLFELSFRDERYLPFEYLGAVSRWRIELPPENNYFDLDTLTDLVLHVSYTAREGGDALREAAAREARGRLPGDGLRLFDVRHDFPDAWPGLRERGSDGPAGDGDGAARKGRPRQLRLGFTPAMFPYVPGRPIRVIDRLLLMFAAPGAASGRHHLVRFWLDEAGLDEAAEVRCVASEAWPGYFRGIIDRRAHPLGPLADDRPLTCSFEFPAEAARIRGAFVVAGYDVARGDPARRGTEG